MKVYNGTAWVNPFFKYPKIYDGTQWVYGVPEVWGSQSSETQTITVGNYSYKGDEQWGFSYIAYGSISDGTFSFGFAVDAPIRTLSWYNITNTITFSLSGNRANSGWTKMTISGVDYTRASATYNYDAYSDQTNWQWTASNPFGTTIGATKTAVFAP
jgi:hypothetical protein